MCKYKIALILPYFGKLPDWFDLWLASVGRNNDIDWLLFTDDTSQYKFPENVYVTYVSWNEMQRRIQINFSFPISIDKPYKLCDYRPAFGEIFSMELKGYDFWGHCDPDCIWGDIRAFLTDSILDKYYKILMRGHLTLYRNIKEVNSWYKTLSTERYKEVYTTNETLVFDEGNPVEKTNSINGLLYKAGIDIYSSMCFDDLYPEKIYFVSRFSRDNYIKATGKEELKKLKYILKYDNGKLYQLMLIGNEIRQYETMYAHFQKRIMKKCINGECSCYYIVPNSFIEFHEIDNEFIEKASKHHIIYPHHVYIRFNNLRRKIRRKFYGYR